MPLIIRSRNTNGGFGFTLVVVVLETVVESAQHRHNIADSTIKRIPGFGIGINVFETGAG